MRRASVRWKGSGFEYDTQASLNQIDNGEFWLTKERGFRRQFDIEGKTTRVSDKGPVVCMIAVECKFHKKLSWNEAKKYFDKLKRVASKHTKHYLIYKTNQQPVLVMENYFGITMVSEFNERFPKPFIKH